ncbi:hypothetical protein MBRA1_000198 [Malassezia brasiliensis]|uniref:DNA mismatch repair proteins mutS family domain-containing protein n=1 Tax=Malassezia brasiliensis TaxID=1821822 RepID=A0AAF0DQK0_9BASI|nr:hypothetical protein MBRA1_000198 [Malassezia brasiliensis]
MVLREGGRLAVRCGAAASRLVRIRATVRMLTTGMVRLSPRTESFALHELPDSVGPRPERAALPHGAPAPAAAEPEWPPLAQCVRDNMQKFPSCLLLTRVGGFYEVRFKASVRLTQSYFDQAPQLAADIGIKLASRKWAGKSIPMAGFPLFQLDKYLKVLVQEKGRLVAICEEFKEGDTFQRRVSRVVSPGTLIDERFLDAFSNNFILSISRASSHRFGLAWLDVSTSDFHTSTCADARTLRDEIVRIQPREVVFVDNTFCRSDAGTQNDDALLYEALDTASASVATIPPPSEHEQHEALQYAAELHTDAERDAIAILTVYLQTRLMDHMHGLGIDTTEARAPTEQVMHLDAQTLGALEIREMARDGSVRGSLISILRRTTTQGGARLLTQWITQPSTSVPLIRARHALVELLVQNAFLRKDVRVLLRTGIGDILRTLQRISLRRNDEQDLLEVRDFVRTTDAIVHRFQTAMSEASSVGTGWAELREMLGKFRSLHELGERLGEAIDERVIEKRIQRQEALMEAHDAAWGGGPAPKDAVVSTKRTSRKKNAVSLELEEPYWGESFEHLIRPDASPVLRALTDEYDALRRKARVLENALRAEFQEPLSLRFLLGQGHVVHIPSPKGVTHESLTLAYKTKTTRTYYHAAWTKIGTKLQKLSARLTEREAQSLEMLRQDVLRDAAVIRRNARLVDQLDVLQSFAQAAEELHLTRPTVDESCTLDIRGGRHLAVEMGLLQRERLFTKNDLTLGNKACMHLVTGPNMGGKSTFLRQNALMAVLAQAGCFVPADAAHIGVVDRIFSRVGAKDDLFHSRSTFMVEMSETAEILRRATPRSFVIADEIGRGTNTAVGLSIAFATLHTLATRIACRTLFATHYYELADLLEHAREASTDAAQALAARVAFFCTTLERLDDGGLRYAHQVHPGVNRASHGLDVARLADMPPDTVDLAARTHAWLERNGHARLSTSGLAESVLV